jgi:hypothetical protein
VVDARVARVGDQHAPLLALAGEHGADSGGVLVGEVRARQHVVADVGLRVLQGVGEPGAAPLAVGLLGKPVQAQRDRPARDRRGALGAVVAAHPVKHEGDPALLVAERAVRVPVGVTGGEQRHRGVARGGLVGVA